MVPSVLVNTAEGSKLVIGGAGGELIISAVAQVNLGASDWNVPSLGAGMGWRGWLVPPPSLHRPALSQVIMNKLWLGFDLGAAIAAPILHVNDKGQVEYESGFSQVRPQSAPPLGRRPQCRPLEAPLLSATGCPVPGSLQLWAASELGCGEASLLASQARAGCCPCFSRAEHLSNVVPALCISLQKLVFLAQPLRLSLMMIGFLL